jgi:hypothetical protein
MYTDGTIIYFDPFYFKNGSTAKPKYFLVLKRFGSNAILASLPSSKVHLPYYTHSTHGCIDNADSCISCYVFQENKPITKCGWAFELNTFVYGNWIDEFSVSMLEEKYQIEGIDYEIIGQLTDTELNKVIDCFKNSSVVKRKYRKILS